MEVPGRNEYRLSLASIKYLAEELGMKPGSKVITTEIEQASSEFYRGFLSGIFDADGSVQGTQLKGVSIRLSQSDLDALQSIQRMLLRLGIYSKIYKNSCLAYRGRKFLRLGKLLVSYSYKRAYVRLGDRVRRPKKVDIVTGVWGALYRVEFFDEEVFNLDLDSPMFYTDDIWFSGMIAKNGITRYVVPMTGSIEPTDQHQRGEAAESARARSADHGRSQGGQRVNHSGSSSRARLTWAPVELH